ncbi:hypothetical protein LCGC14_0336930 [marine sediment metagenome]|uniref:Uncharacterized protein n=1 Tax=marine sediment metagenome TaxID=412755 RepID=A0A0F9W1V2_9ZZZZ
MEEYISNFLVDAQYRVAEFTIQINDIRKRSRKSNDWRKPYLLRLELSIWISVLYEASQNIYDSYNFLSNWNDIQIREECEYLRAKTGITRIPYLSFASYAPEIVVVEGSGNGVPAGTQGQVVSYNASNQPVAASMPTDGGMLEMDIDEFFST